MLVVLVLLGSCGDAGVPVTAGSGAAPDQRHTVSATVLESPQHGPQLCLGGVAESYPPQCSGPDVVGWRWDEVDGEEAAGGTTWGDFSVVGTWDGDQLTLTQPPGPPTPVDHVEVDLSTPCPPPPGGWQVVDASGLGGQGAALEYAHDQPDFAGAWLDQSINPAAAEERPDESVMNDPARLVLNLRFTGDLPRHEAEIRSYWGGALCLTEADRTLRDLERIQQALQEEPDALSSDIDTVQGTVGLTVPAADPALQASLDRRYGEGTVVVTGRLRPVR